MLLLHSRAGCSIQQRSNYNKHICSLGHKQDNPDNHYRTEYMVVQLINTQLIWKCPQLCRCTVAGFNYWLCLETDRDDEKRPITDCNGFSEKRPELGLFWCSPGVSVQQATISSGAHETQECAPRKQPTLRLWHHHHLLHCSDSPVSCVTYSSIVIAKHRWLLVTNRSFDECQPFWQLWYSTRSQTYMWSWEVHGCNGSRAHLQKAGIRMSRWSFACASANTWITSHQVTCDVTCEQKKHTSIDTSKIWNDIYY